MNRKEQDLENVIREGKENCKDLVLVSLKSCKGDDDLGAKCCCKENR